MKKLKIITAGLSLAINGFNSKAMEIDEYHNEGYLGDYANQSQKLIGVDNRLHEHESDETNSTESPRSQEEVKSIESSANQILPSPEKLLENTYYMAINPKQINIMEDLKYPWDEISSYHKKLIKEYLSGQLSAVNCIASRYLEGALFEKDVYKALGLYMYSAQQGEIDAMRALSLIFKEMRGYQKVAEHYKDLAINHGWYPLDVNLEQEGEDINDYF